MDPALGCTPYEFHDKTAAAGVSGSQITDELMAAADQPAPVALVPLNDPMTQVNGESSTMKTNMFRIGVDQPLVSPAQTADTPANYCKDMIQVGEARIRRTRRRSVRSPPRCPPPATTCSRSWPRGCPPRGGTWAAAPCSTRLTRST